jgi:hypothetical protein
MEWDEMKRRRQLAIYGMKSVLDSTEPLGLNVVIVFVMGIPVITWQWLRTALSISIAGLIGIAVMLTKVVMVLFIATYMVVDTFMICTWYLKEIAVKISEEPK